MNNDFIKTELELADKRYRGKMESSKQWYSLSILQEKIKELKSENERLTSYMWNIYSTDDKEVNHMLTTVLNELNEIWDKKFDDVLFPIEEKI